MVEVPRSLLAERAWVVGLILLTDIGVDSLEGRGTSSMCVIPGEYLVPSDSAPSTWLPVRQIIWPRCDSVNRATRGEVWVTVWLCTHCLSYVH